MPPRLPGGRHARAVPLPPAYVFRDPAATAVAAGRVPARPRPRRRRGGAGRLGRLGQPAQQRRLRNRHHVRLDVLVGRHRGDLAGLLGLDLRAGGNADRQRLRALQPGRQRSAVLFLLAERLGRGRLRLPRRQRHRRHRHQRLDAVRGELDRAVDQLHHRLGHDQRHHLRERVVRAAGVLRRRPDADRGGRQWRRWRKRGRDDGPGRALESGGQQHHVFVGLAALDCAPREP
jgi:hypothetical protein